MVESEMNIFLLMQQLRKLKAAVSVIIKDDQTLIDKVENMYIRSSTIYVDDEDEKMYEDSKDKFTRFLDGDIREKKRKSISWSKVGSRYLDKIQSN